MSFTTIGAHGASGLAVLLAAAVGVGCSSQPKGQLSSAPAGSVADLMKERGLSEADVSAALQTYMPTGKKDEYYTFASGGHGGNMIVIGVPSMRILKYVGVFTPEPWQGYGYGDQSNQILEQGRNLGVAGSSQSQQSAREPWTDLHAGEVARHEPVDPTGNVFELFARRWSRWQERLTPSDQIHGRGLHGKTMA